MNTANKSGLELLTADEVAEYLRISKATVYRLVKDRRIPVSNVGRQLRFRKDAIDEWLAKMEGETIE